MHIVVTGANGFIGQHLVTQILNDLPAVIGNSSLKRLTLIDLHFNESESAYITNDKVTLIKGSFADPTILADAIAELPADLVFHLASVPSGATQSNFRLGMEVNVDGIFNLLEILRNQNNNPRLVFASSIAIYGKPESEYVDEDTQPTPNLSYGAQKVIGETLVADYSRRGWVQGCSLRLPGIVVRPPEPNGAISIFFSDLIRNLSAGLPYTCPVSKDAKAWLMSVQCCVNNLIHGATFELDPTHCTWPLPALHLSIEDLVNTIDAIDSASDTHSLITYEVDDWVENNFGSYPPLHCNRAESLGFKHDGNAKNLINKALKRK